MGHHSLEKGIERKAFFVSVFIRRQAPEKVFFPGVSLVVLARVEGSFGFVTRQSRQRHPVGPWSGTGTNHEEDLKNALLVRGLGLGFGVPIGMLIALSVVSYRTVATSNAGIAWLLHTHQVLEKSAGLLSATQDIETGYRGFALTGDS
jgi:CHASE3 domain